MKILSPDNKVFSFISLLEEEEGEEEKIYCFSQTNIGTFFRRGQHFFKNSRLCRSIVNKKYPTSFLFSFVGNKV